MWSYVGRWINDVSDSSSLWRDRGRGSCERQFQDGRRQPEPVDVWASLRPWSLHTPGEHLVHASTGKLSHVSTAHSGILSERTDDISVNIVIFCNNSVAGCPIFRKILYEDEKSASNDGRMWKLFKIWKSKLVEKIVISPHFSEISDFDKNFGDIMLLMQCRYI